jgi:hypothetical protein
MKINLPAKDKEKSAIARDASPYFLPPGLVHSCYNPFANRLSSAGNPVKVFLSLKLNFLNTTYGWVWCALGDYVGPHFPITCLLNIKVGKIFSIIRFPDAVRWNWRSWLSQACYGT